MATKMSEVQVDLTELIKAFGENEVVKYNIGSIVTDFEMMHVNVSFEEGTTEEEMKVTKLSQIGTFICGVISASSPMSEFQRNLKLPDTHEHTKKSESDKFAKSLQL